MDSYLIQLVQQKDRQEWLRLRCALWPDHKADELAKDIPEMLRRMDAEPVFVARMQDGGLCGMIEAGTRPHAPGCSTEQIGYIEGWYVDPEYRRRGVGRALVEAVESWAREKGCTEMASDTTDRYPLSPAAHQCLGYQPVKHVIHYRKSLI